MRRWVPLSCYSPCTELGFAPALVWSMQVFMSQSWCSALLAGKINGRTKWLAFIYQNLLHHLNIMAPLLTCLSNITVCERKPIDFGGSFCAILTSLWLRLPVHVGKLLKIGPSPDMFSYPVNLCNYKTRTTRASKEGQFSLVHMFYTEIKKPWPYKSYYLIRSGKLAVNFSEVA